MVIGPDFSRDMQPDEEAEVDALLRAAFGGEDEVDLVHRLRRDRDMAAEIVKPWQGRIAGYAALSRMRAPEGWLCLAPVAVLPDFQRGSLAPPGQDKQFWQIGRRLVSELVQSIQLEALGGSSMVVLGQPEFYEKCGFSRARAARLTTPYPVEYTMLAAPGEDAPQETLIYPAAFGEDPTEN